MLHAGLIDPAAHSSTNPIDKDPARRNSGRALQRRYRYFSQLRPTADRRHEQHHRHRRHDRDPVVFRRTICPRTRKRDSPADHALATGTSLLPSAGQTAHRRRSDGGWPRLRERTTKPPTRYVTCMVRRFRDPGGRRCICRPPSGRVSAGLLDQPAGPARPTRLVTCGAPRPSRERGAVPCRCRESRRRWRVRLPSVRLPSVRLPSVRLPSVRLPSVRLRRGHPRKGPGSSLVRRRCCNSSTVRSSASTPVGRGFRSAGLARYDRPVAKVSQASISPVSKPRWNQPRRCAALPWVKLSGTT